MTPPFAGQTWWIVGASEGLGRALAHALNAQGARLILSARDAQRLTDLAATLDNAQTLPMDVTDPASVAAAYKQAGDWHGLIYCAGTYAPMTAQNWDAPAVTRMCQTNFMGAVHVLNHAVPHCTARDAGHLVLIGSLAGHRGLPGAIGYGASKSALMHLAQTLYADLRGTGTRVSLINPGFIRTRLTALNDFDMPQLMEPETAARHTLRAIRSGRFQTDFPAPFSWVFTWGRFLPYRLFLRLFG